MNVLNIANALKEIKIKQLDDELQVKIISVINKAFPLNVNISSETTGSEIIDLLDNDVPRELREGIIQATVFVDDEIRRFFVEIDRVKREMVKNVDYDDTVKSTFISHGAFLIIIIVFAMMGGYTLTTSVRGELPESRVLPVIQYLIHSLSNDQNIIKHETGG